MQVAFRVDESPQIGSGHFARCLALADALRQAGSRTRLISRHITSALGDLVKAKGHELKLLPADKSLMNGDLAYATWLGTSQESDARDTESALAGEDWDWLVVDHYALDTRWERRLRKVARKILAIDDLADRIHDCDALVDQNLQLSPDRYRGLLPDNCRELIGPRHALLRSEFRSVPKRKFGSVRRINIFFGGFDVAGVTGIALDEVSHQLKNGIVLDVVVGIGNPRLDDIRAQCIMYGANLYVQTSEMAQLFAAADIGIGAGGTTSWERCRVGLPTLLIAVAENQVSGCRGLENAGAGVFLGKFEDITPGAIGGALANLMSNFSARKAMSENCSILLDGRGAERVMLHMMRDEIVLRAATPKDARRAWRWRNHPQTRQFSSESAELPWRMHRDWWYASLNSSARHLLIASCGGIDFGVLRLDCSDDRATVSIYLDPELSNLGLGSATLQAGLAFAREAGGIRFLDATILRINRRSQRSFLAAGYRQISEEVWTRPVICEGRGAHEDRRSRNRT